MSEENDPTPPPMDESPSTPPPADTPPPMDMPPPSDGSLPVPGQGKLTDKDDKTFGMLGHLLGIFTGFLGPLVIWLIKKEESPFVDDQGKEALNFQITLAIGWVAAFILTMLAGIGCVLYPVIWVVALVFGIQGTMKANEGIAYRYPFALRLVN